MVKYDYHRFRGTKPEDGKESFFFERWEAQSCKVEVHPEISHRKVRKIRLMFVGTGGFFVCALKKLYILRRVNCGYYAFYGIV